MKFFFKCIAVFVVITGLLIALDEFVFHFPIVFSGIVLFSGVISMMLSIIYGWIDDVFINHRQPELEEKLD